MCEENRIFLRGMYGVIHAIIPDNCPTKSHEVDNDNEQEATQPKPEEPEELPDQE